MLSVINTLLIAKTDCFVCFLQRAQKHQTEWAESKNFWLKFTEQESGAKN